ncbi:hypothetical protein TREPR_1885 [Treponema primitia ZAS-2]|uniref:Uncharacterized protein n=1 Tax=Treponema primitia (strain ATCC BAA-887 / DSM 12427 / ZAS-2) TaxID=545694 RepID=F5YL46_TREPZ|nr:hypothetical protein [Treponema primitia]AEF86628.1 hypothetical protein TREPR_1885 [Treponema primitia ZAS-2]
MKTIKRWDFEGHDILSEKQQTLFIRLHEVFIRTFTSILSTMFAVKSIVSVTKCHQCKYEEFIGENKNFKFLLEEIFDIQGKEYNVFLDIDAVFYSMILDKLFGGKAKVVGKIDRITEIEEAMLIKKFDETFRLIFQNTQNKSVIINSFLEASSLNGGLNNNGVVITINIAIDNIETGIKVFYPEYFIKNVMEKN